MTANALAAQATSLLLQFAERGDPAAASAYDDLLYRFLFLTIKTRAQLLARQASFLTGAEIQLPTVPVGDLDAVAHDTTVAALARARATAARFDASRGDGATWALNAAALAYVDVVRAHFGIRRAMQTTPMEPGALAEVADRSHSAADPADVIETRQAIDAALATLTADERFAIVGHLQSGLSYAEIALYRFGDASQTKKVDRIMQSARRKLADAERAWRGGTDAA